MSKLSLSKQALDELAKVYGDKLVQIVEEEVNKGLDEMAERVRQNYEAQGIRVRSGKLISGTKIRRMRKGSFGRIINEVYNTKVPKNPGIHTESMRNRYKKGVPYGRLIEFSPRINKPFFYPAVDSVKEDVLKRIKGRMKQK